MTRVLVIEDEESFRDALQFMLSREGFDVILAPNGAEGMKLFDSKNPDIVLLDLMLPEVSGTEVCKYIRTKSNVPVIMLTAKDTEIDKVVGLELGADDYVTKPFSTRELLARIKAVLRRGGDFEVDSVGAIEGGPIRMDVERHALSVNGTAVAMPLKEFELLELLASRPGKVFNRDQILSVVWGNETIVGERTIDVHIRKLREKLGDDYIRTIKGVGYTFKDK